MKLLFALILLAGTAAHAQAPAAAPAVMPPPAVLPLAKAAKPRVKKVVAANPNLVEAKTASGRIVHYDCSKKGNLHKVACKK